MLRSHPNTLHITKLSHSAIHQLAPSFAQLPHTNHADGQYRLRRYSVIRFIDGQVVELDKHDFMQTDQINHFQGNVVRRFEPLLSTTLKSDGMRELCALFMEANTLPDGQEIEIHQMRIAAVFDETLVAPEGCTKMGLIILRLLALIATTLWVAKSCSISVVMKRHFSVKYWKMAKLRCWPIANCGTTLARSARWIINKKGIWMFLF